MSLNDRKLIQKILQGEAPSLFWQHWTGKIKAFLGNAHVTVLEDREDLTQEVMMKVYKALDRWVAANGKGGRPFLCSSYE
ncbi:MAG: sigma factor [Spirochaetaceae bacterium]|jgi:hypothetical protein|nr:sigma factor [Spirochaetaceae bacterium]